MTFAVVLHHPIDDNNSQGHYLLKQLYRCSCLDLDFTVLLDALLCQPNLHRALIHSIVLALGMQNA